MVSLETPICDFGWEAADFQLPGTDGKTYGPRDVMGANGLLVCFICNHCPYVRAIIDRLVADTRKLKDEGIGTLAVMPNDTQISPEDSFARMQVFARDHDFHFPYVIDETQDVARAYGAVCTPDFFGFNSRFELQYRGRLDASRKEAAPHAQRELLEAMQQVARTGEGPRDQVPSMGCSIKWRAA